MHLSLLILVRSHVSFIEKERRHGPNLPSGHGITTTIAVIALCQSIRRIPYCQYSGPVNMIFRCTVDGGKPSHLAVICVVVLALRCMEGKTKG